MLQLFTVQVKYTYSTQKLLENTVWFNTSSNKPGAVFGVLGVDATQIIEGYIKTKYTQITRMTWFLGRRLKAYSWHIHQPCHCMPTKYTKYIEYTE